MENKEFKIQKVPLDNLLNTLVDIYNSGVDYVDIIGMPGEEYDNIGITFTRDYMTEEGKKHFKDISKNLEITSERLTDDDINQLV
jgi:hypothetical protein